MPQGTLFPKSLLSPTILTGISSQGGPDQEDQGTTLSRESIHAVERDGLVYLVSENYSYKSEAYYSILEREILGQRIIPSTSSILDAFVVPICLERAHHEGIPVADYSISQSCIPVPAVIYGLNYFACTSHFEVLQEDAREREMIRHVTEQRKNIPSARSASTKGCGSHGLSRSSGELRARIRSWLTFPPGSGSVSASHSWR